MLETVYRTNGHVPPERTVKHMTLTPEDLEDGGAIRLCPHCRGGLEVETPSLDALLRGRVSALPDDLPLLSRRELALFLALHRFLGRWLLTSDVLTLAYGRDGWSPHYLATNLSRLRKRLEDTVYRVESNGRNRNTSTAYRLVRVGQAA